MLEEAEELWREYRGEALAVIKNKNRDDYDIKRQRLRKKAQSLERDARDLTDKAKEAVLREADVSCLL